MRRPALALLPLLLLLNACHAETPPAAPNTKLPALTQAAKPTGLPDFHNKKLHHNGCLITVEHNHHFHPARHCNGSQTAANPEISLLSDSKPIAWGDHILLLGNPDSESYPHGVLGDAIEAKTLYTLHAQTLQPSAEPFTLPSGFVFENNTVTLWGDQVVAVISGGGAGARVAVLGLENGRWHIRAESTPLPANRWQSPFVFQNQLYAVQMPHLRGRLVRYEIKGKHLTEHALGDGLSNHAIGSRLTQTAAVLPDYTLIPHMGYRRLSALDASGQLHTLAPELPAAVVNSAVHNGRSYWLLENGSVWTWPQP